MALGHRILVPLDGSDFAERVLPLATSLAAHADGTLHLLAVHVPVFPPAAPAGAAAIVAEAQQYAHDAMSLYLDRVAARLDVPEGVKVHTELRTGLADTEILDACRDAGGDLIAMATHGRSGFRRLWLGSVADRVVRNAAVPVLLVSARGEEGEEAAATLPPVPSTVRTVIIPLDGSKFAESALVPATALGEAFSADYILFRSVPPPGYHGAAGLSEAAPRMAELLEHERMEARGELDQVAERLAASGFSVSVTVAEESDPAPTLLRLAHAAPDSVIAMTTHGRGGLRRAVLGSVADKVVRAATAPVLLVRPVDQAS